MTKFQVQADVKSIGAALSFLASRAATGNGFGVRFPPPSKCENESTFFKEIGFPDLPSHATQINVNIYILYTCLPM